LVEKFKNVALRNIGLFELPVHLNDLAEKYSESVVKHTFVNARSIMRMAQKLKFISDNPGEETVMPVTKPVERPTMTVGQINGLMTRIEDVHDLCLMCMGLFCATRTSETFGLQWKCYCGDSLIHSTAYEGELYSGQVKTEASRNAVPIPDDIAPIIEAWHQVCPDTSPDASCSPPMELASASGNRFRDVPRTSSNGGFTQSPTS
jgi:integrase